MTKIYLNELTYEQRKELIRNCESLERKLYDAAIDNAQFLAGEYLDGCPCSYQIGSYSQGEHFRIPDSKVEDTEIWWNDVCKTFCIPEDTINTVSEFFKAYHKYDEIADSYYNDGATYEEMKKAETETYEKQDAAEQAIYNLLMQEYNAADEIEVLADEFFFLMIEDGEKDGYYTDEELSGVWNDVPEMVIPAHTEKLY